MKNYSHGLRIRIFSYLLWNSIQRTADFFHISPKYGFLLKKLFIETGSYLNIQFPWVELNKGYMSMTKNPHPLAVA